MTNAPLSRPRALSSSLAILWLLVAVAVSEWGVTRWLGPAGAEALPRARVPLAMASGLFVALALATWWRGDRPAMRRLNLVALSFLVAGPLFAEAALRLSFQVDGSPTRSPIRFAHNLIDDDYWVLAGRWDTHGQKIEPKRIHPTLGWSQGWISEANPFGLVARTRDQLSRDGRRKVLFYGDSYVAGIAAEENWIPVYVDDRLPETDVVNLGVGGYGTGQAHLLLRETCELVDRPFVIMSAMVYDIDRSTLSVRSYQKPRLRVGPGGELEVSNVPVSLDPEAYFRSARLSFNSFMMAALVKRLFTVVDPHFPEKLDLNRAIIDANQELATTSGAGLLYVLFHPLQELLETDYRSTFFLEELEARGIDVFDTRGPLLAYIESEGIDPRELYVNGHHNDRGNQVIGEALILELRELGFD